MRFIMMDAIMGTTFNITLYWLSSDAKFSIILFIIITLIINFITDYHQRSQYWVPPAGTVDSSSLSVLEPHAAANGPKKRPGWLNLVVTKTSRIDTRETRADRPGRNPSRFAGCVPYACHREDRHYRRSYRNRRHCRYRSRRTHRPGGPIDDGGSVVPWPKSRSGNSWRFDAGASLVGVDRSFSRSFPSWWSPVA